MIVTTTNTVEGHRIDEYLGVVTGEAILGANVIRDFFAGVRDIIGGRSGAYEKELRKPACCIKGSGFVVQLAQHIGRSTAEA